MSHYKCNHLVHSSPQSDDAFPPTAILFEYCLNIKNTDKSGWMPLHIAAGSLNTEAIAALIASGANTNFTTTTCGRTALHIAVRAASSKASRILGVNTDCISLLLSNGANVNIQDREGRTPVHEACSGGRREIVDLLLEYKADMNSLTRDGQSPVFLFLQQRSHLKDRALLNKLLGFSYPLMLRDNQGNLPTGLLFSEFQMLKDFLLTLSQKLLSLEDICKITVRRIYGENNKYWLKSRLPATVWNSLYSYQDIGKYVCDDNEQEGKLKCCKAWTACREIKIDPEWRLMLCVLK